MNDDCLKLTTYFGERDRAGGAFLADAIIDIYGRHRLQTSLVMRGVEGFGQRQHLHSDRLLTLSEDLPLVAVAVDTRERIEAALAEIAALRFDGLVTLERARLLTGPAPAPVKLPWASGDDAKLTVYLGRGERIDGSPAHRRVVEFLRRRKVAGATVLLGVDGTAHGERRRARFLGRNGGVPLMVIAVGASGLIGELVPELTAMLPRSLLTLERVTVCKRDGMRVAEPRSVPQMDRTGLGIWQKLMVYAGEQSKSGDRPLHGELVRELRRAGASGATSLRGIWGYHGDHAPHGDSFWQLRRRVPIVTVIVDTPERARRWFEIVDRLTGQAGLVTSETVPAFRATARGREAGGFRLAEPLA